MLYGKHFENHTKKCLQNIKVSCLVCKSQVKFKNLLTHICRKWYQCDICKRKFKTEKNLISHTHEVKIKQPKQKLIKTSKIKPKRYKCECCNKFSYEMSNFDHICNFVKVKVSCIKCKKICKGGLQGLRNHNKRDPNCDLSKEEKRK